MSRFIWLHFLAAFWVPTLDQIFWRERSFQIHLQCFMSRVIWCHFLAAFWVPTLDPCIPDPLCLTFSSMRRERRRGEERRVGMIDRRTKSWIWFTNHRLRLASRTGMPCYRSSLPPRDCQNAVQVVSIFTVQCRIDGRANWSLNITIWAIIKFRFAICDRQWYLDI